LKGRSRSISEFPILKCERKKIEREGMREEGEEGVDEQISGHKKARRAQKSIII
jgi:hypothetical protein